MERESSGTATSLSSQGTRSRDGTYRLWRPPLVRVRQLDATRSSSVSSHGSPGGALRTESPSRKRASIPRPERMVQATPAFGVSPVGEADARLRDRPPDDSPRAPGALARRLRGTTSARRCTNLIDIMGPGRASRKTRKQPATRCRPRASATSPTGTAPSSRPRSGASGAPPSRPTRQGRRRHVGHRIDTWARQTKHADGDHVVPLRA